MGVEPLYQSGMIGQFATRSRLVITPHAMSIGQLLGTKSQARVTLDYWRRLAEQGPAWAVAYSLIVDSPVPHGFERRQSPQRPVLTHPLFAERLAELAAVLHAEGTHAVCQLVVPGGDPHAPGTTSLSPVEAPNVHQMSAPDIAAVIDSFADAASRLEQVGFRGVELHACHDDLIEWFLTPRSNNRDDDWGGDSLQRRATFLRRILAAIRARVDVRFLVGVRLTIDQVIPGGTTVSDAAMLARMLEHDGHIDYLAWVAGSNWGPISYMAPPPLGRAFFRDALADIKQTLTVPVVYSGRVLHPGVAEELIRSGTTDFVGIARAVLAEPNWLSKGRAGRSADIRPCIGTNDCLHRPLNHGLPTACTVNPALLEMQPAAKSPRRLEVTVVGAGPAGLEAAASAAEIGHFVTVLECGSRPGGQLRRMSGWSGVTDYDDYAEYLYRRCLTAGVTVEFGVDPTLWTQSAPGTVKIFAGGAIGRTPPYVPAANPRVVLARRLMPAVDGSVGSVGADVAVLAEDDGMEPLMMAAALARSGRRLTYITASRTMAAAVGRYNVGAYLADLQRAGTRMWLMRQVVAIADDHIVTTGMYGDDQREHGPFDTIVVSAGNESAVARSEGADYTIGDAHTPWGLLAATRQARQLALTLGHDAMAKSSPS